MNAKEKAALSLINRSIMDAKFLDNDNYKGDSIFRNLLSSKQITPLPVSIKMDTDGLVFSSKHFEIGKMNIKYDSIDKVEFTILFQTGTYQGSSNELSDYYISYQYKATDT